MLLNLVRILSRQYPCGNFYCINKPIRVNSMYITDERISTSCINIRLCTFEIPKGKIDTWAGEGPSDGVSTRKDEDQILRHDEKELDEKDKDMREYVSDESEDEVCKNEPQLQNFNINFVTLPRRSVMARREIQQSILETNFNSDKFLVKTIFSIKKCMKQGLKPEKVFFSILNDLLNLDMSLDGIELFKIHPLDAPIEMQRKKMAPCFAVFPAPQAKLQLQSRSSIPLTVICDKLPRHKSFVKIISAALSCGCEEVLITKFDDISEGRRNSPNSFPSFHDLIPISYNQSWDMINEKVPIGTNIFVVNTGKQMKRVLFGKSDLPTVDFNEIEPWSSSRVALICAEYLEDEALSFCIHRDAREIVIPGAVPSFSTSFMALGAIALELKKQWEMTQRAKKA